MDTIHRAIDQCLIRDRHGFRRELARANNAQQKQKLVDAISVSQQSVETRKAEIPTFSFPEILPISAKADDIISQIKQHRVLIIAGETGSGKSTQLPKYCLAAGQGIYGKIAHTQPRRIATRAIANRLAQELNVPLGKGVGYRVRYEEKCSDADYIRVLTDGMLLAEAQGDRFLNQYDTIIIDEAHERSLNSDFLFGVLKQLLQKRADLKLIVTSATIDTKKFSAFFNDAPVINVSGRSYPVELIYAPPEDEKTRSDAQTNQTILDAINRLFKTRAGNTLVFLPGEREIREAQKFLSRHLKSGLDILPLYSRLASAEQSKLFRASNTTRVILSTNVAETSLTLPDIDYVIDVGLARVSRYSPSRRVNTLPIERVSRASADQRKGRCGRVKNGVCVRLYSEEDFNLREAFTAPEIMRTALTGVLLSLKSRRLGEPENFGFIDLPKRNQLNVARQELRLLGIFDAQDSLSNMGVAIAKMPVDPRIGRMIYAAAYSENCLSEMIILAASLEVADPRFVPHEAMQAARQHHLEQAVGHCDFFALLTLYSSYIDQSQNLSRKGLRQWCEKNYLAHGRMREWRDLAMRLKRDLAALAVLKAPAKTDAKTNKNKAKKISEEAANNLRIDSVHRALLSGLLDQVAMRTDKAIYAGTYGKQMMLFPGSALAKAAPKWIMAAEMVETSQLFARTVAPIKTQWIETLAGELLRREYAEPYWSKKSGHVLVFERASFLGLPIYSGRRIHYGSINTEESRALFIRDALLEGEINGRFDFIEHNMEMVEQLIKLEHKIRRHDVMVSDEVLSHFYDRLLPAHVCSESGLRKWLGTLDDTAQGALELTEKHLLKRSLSEDEVKIPNQLALRNYVLPLDYEFAPGEEKDGMSARIPLPLLNQFKPADFDKLVPGYLSEKLAYLIKSLPKPARKKLMPLVDTIDFVNAAFEADAQNGKNEAEKEKPLVEILARLLSARGGFKIKAEDFDLSRLPAHLSMKLVVVDEAGDEMGSGESITALQQSFGSQASEVIADTSSDWQQTNLMAWTFGDIPPSVEIGAHEIKTHAFPALVDAEEGVHLQLFDDQNTALLAHQQGLIRLMQISTPFGQKLAKRALPYWHEIHLRYLPIGAPQALRADLVDAVLLEMVFASNDSVRSLIEFEKKTAEAEKHFRQAIEPYAQALLQALNVHNDCLKLLEKAALQNIDVQNQLNFLIYEDFLLEVPLAQLLNYPTYFKALLLRLERQDFDAQGDAKKLALLQPYWQKYLKHYEAHPSNQTLEAYRWLLEAYRVALFAPGVKPPVTVSPKRLDLAWALFEAE